MNYIITKNKSFFVDIGEYNYCPLEDLLLLPELIAIDTECTGLNARKDKLFCIQIGTGINNYIIDLQHYCEGKTDGFCPQDVFPYLKGKTLCFFNSLFDLGFFYQEGFFPLKVKDPMLASKILYNGNFLYQRNDFKIVMERELGIFYDKTNQKNIHIVKLSQSSTISYAFSDVDRLLELSIALEKKIDEGGFRETYDLHCDFIKALAYMEQCGMPISTEKWKNKIQNDLQNSTKYKEDVEEYIYNNIPSFQQPQLSLFDEVKHITVSTTSPLQMLKVFKKLEINTKDKDGKDSIKENIISKSNHEFVDVWVKYQEANHRVTTFGENILQHVDNERIYTNFNPMVNTARLSTRQGHVNFLNFPSDKETRDCFSCNNESDIIVCDYSSQEGVVMADLSGDEAMTDSVLNDVDLHCLLTRKIFPELELLTEEEIKTNHKKERNISKTVRFLLSYGGNSYTLHINEGFDLKEAQNMENSYKELHAGLYEWGNRVLKTSLETGFIESADGWKLCLPKFDQYKTLEESIKEMSKQHWTVYREGKQEHNKQKEAEEKEKIYNVKFPISLKYYISKRKMVSDYFKLRSEYQRLCLNFPVQARAAHQLKRSVVKLFDWIVENNYFWKIKICNMIHDKRENCCV